MPQLSPTSGLSLMFMVIFTIMIFVFCFNMLNNQKLSF